MCVCVHEKEREKERDRDRKRRDVIEKQQSSKCDSSGRLCMDSCIIASTYRDKCMFNVCMQRCIHWCVHMPY